jgi:Domain of unknown function (DUF4265)
MPSLTFRLEVADGWPPVGAECLPCVSAAGGSMISAPPLFVRDLSVGDVIAITVEDQGQILSWEHVSRSDHSTVWILTFGETSIAAPLECLLGLGCNVASLPAWSLSSIDVPPSVAAGLLDGLFSEFPESAVAVVYPSWRHPEAPVA